MIFFFSVSHADRTRPVPGGRGQRRAVRARRAGRVSSIRAGGRPPPGRHHPLVVGRPVAPVAGGPRRGRASSGRPSRAGGRAPRGRPARGLVRAPRPRAPRGTGGRPLLARRVTAPPSSRCSRCRRFDYYHCYDMIFS